MRFKTLMIIAVALTAFLPSCVDKDTDLLGNWVTKATYVGKARAYGSSFAINGYGYWGMGRDEDDYLSDFWKYDPVKDSWTQVADFRGTPRAYNISTSTSTTGFVGLGYDGDNDLDDIWAYDAETNEWTEIKTVTEDLGARRFASAFAIDNNLYIGLGSMDDMKIFRNDFYKFDGESWTNVAALRGDKRHKANVAVLNGKAHVISGQSNNGTLNDHYVYDPSADNWTKLEEVTDEDTGDTGIPRYSASTYAANGKIYLTAGSNGSSLTSTYEWDPTLEEEGAWIEKTSIETGYGQREGAGFFVLDGYGYIVGGRSNSTYKDDCYMFQPYAEVDSDDN